MRTLSSFQERTKSSRAIDCLPLTKKHHALVISADEFHPAKAGHAIYSRLWFEALLKHDGLEVPAWIAEEMDAALKLEKETLEAPKKP